MAKYILVALVFLTGCSYKIVAKNCIQNEESEYSICDSLNGFGK
jgi:hypothetical protein